MWKRKVIVILMLCVMLCVSAFAQDTIEMDAMGSISLTLSIGDQPVPGGEVTLYHVGEVYLSDEAYGFRYFGEFVGCRYPLTGDLLSEQLAYNIWDYALENDIEGINGTVDDQGKVTFTNLPVGLYLMCQKESLTENGYLPMNPFLISVPSNDPEAGLVYDVVADPKCTIDTGTTPTPSPTPTPPTPGGRIPDTGQNNWPVPVLAISGLLIFALGWAMRFSGRNSKDET